MNSKKRREILLRKYIKEVEQQCNNLLNEIIKSKDKAIDFDMKMFELTVDSDLKKEIEGSEK